SRTNGSMTASTSSGWCTTRSGPSATTSSSSSVTKVAISTMASRLGSRPVISRSIHTSTRSPYDGLTRQDAAVLELEIVRLDPDLPLPAYARPGDAGLDLQSRVEATVPRAGGRVLVPTGIAVAIPPGHAGLVMPRSGAALEHGITLVNSPGVI